MAKQTTKKQTANKTTRKTNSKKKEEEKKRSIIPLLLLIILLLLGVIAWTYRDKLQVMWASGITYLNNQDKTEKNRNKSEKKHSDNDNPLQKAISKLENKTTTTTTTIRKAVSTTTVRQHSTTTTTVKKFVPVTTTTTTVRPKPKATTTTSTTTTTTTTTTVRKAEPTTTTTVRTANASKPVVKTRTSKVYFTRVTMDDSYIVAANREVHYIDSPLTETINVLLQGTNIAEDKKYIVTNIPDNTRLLSARIANNIAYLDFSGEFEENFYGRDSTMYQLQQIVYTATEFDGVDAVQILINGKKQDYLGGEGILIGEPLRRQDFSSR